MRITNRRTALLMFLAAGCSLAVSSSSTADEVAAVSRILFGSCIKQEQPMPILETIVAERPELFIFLGDNIYADTSDMQVMRAKYAKLQADPGFAKLIQACPILATWDDHDYGVNDGGADYAKKAESQAIFVDFWNDPPESPRRGREGVYDASLYGPPGKRVQVILLDTRYFRSQLALGDPQVGGRYVPAADPDLTVLGEAQWKWLEEQLRVPAEIRIIATSIQLLATASGQETWANLPLERERMLRLIETTQAQGVVLISGDRHWSELSALEEAVSYPLYELTSSSLNQLHPRGTPTKNLHRALPNTFHRENYGVIAIDWDKDDPSIRLEIRDLDKTIRLQKVLHLSQLRPAIRRDAD